MIKKGNNMGTIENVKFSGTQSRCDKETLAYIFYNEVVNKNVEM